MIRAGRALAVTLGLAALSACDSAPSSRGSSSDALVGAWRSQIKVGSGVLASMRGLEFMTVFNAGGTMTESSNFDGAPPVPPAYGAWRRTADGAFEARYSFWVTRAPAALEEITKGGGWSPNGYGTLTEKITVAPDRQSYVSSLTYAFFEADGKPAPGGGTATARALRLGFAGPGGSPSP